MQFLTNILSSVVTKYILGVLVTITISGITYYKFMRVDYEKLYKECRAKNKQLQIDIISLKRGIDHDIKIRKYHDQVEKEVDKEFDENQDSFDILAADSNSSNDGL